VIPRLPLKNFDFASIAKLIILYLKNCEIDIGTFSPLAKCKRLSYRAKLKLSSDVLRAIEGDFVTLQCKLKFDGLERLEC
jgi:hypothetical protein